MEWSPQFFVQVIMCLAAGVGAYAGVRYDLGKLHEKADNASKVAQRAHERIAEMMQQGHR